MGAGTTVWEIGKSSAIKDGVSNSSYSRKSQEGGRSVSNRRGNRLGDSYCSEPTCSLLCQVRTP
jgi:hypothetical protein